MNVILDPPIINFDTIRFTWTDGRESPPDGGLFYRYEGIDLSRFSQELWMEIWLALRLRSFLWTDGKGRIQLPTAVPRPVADFWRTYYGLPAVEIEPISEAQSFSPWVDPSTKVDQSCEVALFFGGGRDSLSAACVLGEIHGRDRVLLVQCIDPHIPGEERRQQVTDRFQRLSLGPMHDVLGFATQRVWTNLHAVAFADAGKKSEPHLEQYSAGLLPVMLHYGVSYSTFGLPWGDYLITQREDLPHFHYDLSRPEILAAQGRHHRKVLGSHYTPRNISMALNGVLSFRLLANRYPDAFPWILSCQGGWNGARWCHRCQKCARYGLSCLHESVKPVGFDLNRLLTISPWINELISGLQDVEAPPAGENVPWKKGWCSSSAYQGYCDAFFHADYEWANARMRPDAFYNFMLAKVMYGAKSNPITNVSPAEAYDGFPPELAGPLRTVIGSIATIEPLGDRQIETGDGQPTWGPWAFPFHHPLQDLPHLQ